MDLGDLCEKYEMPKKEDDKLSSNKNNSNKSQKLKENKEITNFEEKGKI